MKVAHSKASSGLVQLSTAFESYVKVAHSKAQVFLINGIVVFESYVKVAHSKAVKMEDIVIPSLRAM